MPEYFLMHGTLDTVAPAVTAVELAEALRRLGVSVTTNYVIEGHSQLVIALMSARRRHYAAVHEFVLRAIDKTINSN